MKGNWHDGGRYQVPMIKSVTPSCLLVVSLGIAYLRPVDVGKHVSP